MKFRVIISFLASLSILVGILNACTPNHTILEQVQNSGELRVLTRNAPTSYYDAPNGPTGLEYDLTKRFAEYLGVKLKLYTPDSLNDILNDISNGRAHIAAAGLTITKERKKYVKFTVPYQYITQQLIYKSGNTKPKNIFDAKGHLEVIANSSHVERLKILKAKNPDLNWYESKDEDGLELMHLVAEELIDYTIGDSNEIALNMRFYPTIRVAFNVSKPQPLAWAFPNSSDTSLFDEANKFILKLQKTGELASIIRRNYGHVDNYDYTGTKTFLRHVTKRLPRYKNLFESAAIKTNLDWRLLAAVAYQESHWNQHAVSPTGVRGLMMLTRVTAKHLGVQKRTDPVQSIDGGARYIRKLLDKIPTDIKEPDRTWMALASYNVGYGHVRDAQIITRKRGGNPNKWIDVKENLPLLRKRRWYKKTRYGYARGTEPVHYVENIRSYYDILAWHQETQIVQKVDPTKLAIVSPVL
ncbi:MAG: membrane-bound lytic murein transglycosylase MltF [Gammaproteobacteria bacterium]